MAWYWWVLLVYLLIGVSFVGWGRTTYGPVKWGAAVAVIIGWFPICIWIICEQLFQKSRRP